VRLWIGAAFACLAGCSLFTPFSGYASGDPDVVVTPPDGGVVDAVAAEGGSPDAALGWCASLQPPAFLCADFDDDTLPGSWREVLAMGGGEIKLDTQAARSLPRSVLITTPQSGTDVRTALIHSLPQIPTEIDVQLDVRVETFGAPSFDLLTIFGIDTTGLGFEVDGEGRLSIDDDRLTPSGGVAESTVPTGRQLSTEWTHIAFVSTRNDGGMVTRLYLDGDLVITHPSPANTFANASLFIGDWVVAQLDATWRVRVDNVVARIR
jgi:hypothetical protein